MPRRLMTMKVLVATGLLATGSLGVAAAEDAHNGDVHPGEHDEHEDEMVVRMSVAEQEEFGVRLMTAGPGVLGVHVSLPGEIRVNPDRLAHLVPRVSGVAQRVLANVGDQVHENQVLAVLESRELSELKSTYLVAVECLALALTTFAREEKLWRQSISSERMYLEAQKGLVEARIEQRVAEQKLHALGFTHEYLANLSFDDDACATSSIFPVDDFHFSRSCVVPPTVFVPCSEELVARCGYPFSSAASNLSTRVGFGEVAIIDRLPVDRLRSIVTGDRPCPGIWTPPRNGRFPISTTFVE